MMVNEQTSKALYYFTKGKIPRWFIRTN